MSDKFELVAQMREDVGKGASRRLRREADLIPGVIYGGGKAPIKISLPHNIVVRRLEDAGFASSILEVNVNNKIEKTVLKDIQRHPSKARILHMDFLRVRTNDPITMTVPLHFIGTEEALGVKEGGIASQVMTEIEIKCLPKDLPEAIEVSVSELTLGHSIHLSDIVLPEGVAMVSGEIDEEHDLPIYSIHAAKIAVEEEEVEAAAPEAGEEEPKSEGE